MHAKPWTCTVLGPSPAKAALHRPSVGGKEFGTVDLARDGETGTNAQESARGWPKCDSALDCGL
jgi:hypothetical protein